MNRISLVGFLLLTVATSSASGARFLTMQINQKGKPILKTVMGDNGHPDADEVWLYLHNARFEPTKDFKPKDGAKELVLKDVEIQVQYGGFIKTRELHLTYKPKKAGGKEVWAIDSKTIDLFFNHRYVKRGDIGRLKDPKRRISRRIPKIKAK